jgi:hypothetical protein
LERLVNPAAKAFPHILDFVGDATRHQSYQLPVANGKIDERLFVEPRDLRKRK